MERLPTRVWYLELASRATLRPPARPLAARAAIARAELPSGAHSRFFYDAVGAGHHWLDRRAWTDAQWEDWVARPDYELWLVHDRGTPAGYAELLTGAPAGHIAYLGLLEPFHGRGLGGHLLTAACRRLFDAGAARVSVETCELDGPTARANYLARGFAVARETVESRPRAAA